MIAIKDMEMPKTCTMCWLSPMCKVHGEKPEWLGYDTRMEGCPLVEIVDDKEIDAMPTVDAVPVVHGRWIPTHDRGMFSHPYSITYVCSECGYSFYTLAGMPPKTKYCPECGAKMDEVTE